METNNLNQATQTSNQQQSGLGIAGMVIGIISVLLSCIIIGGFLGIIGLALSIAAITQKGKKKGFSIAGLVLNTISIIIMIIVLATGASITSNPEPVTTHNTQPVQKVEESVPENDGYATLEKFNQIETGMTYEAVVDIMGSEGTVLSESEVMDIKTTMYYWYSQNGISNMNVTIQNGEVVSKAQLGLD